MVEFHKEKYWKLKLLEKLSNIPQKILTYRSRRADSKNIRSRRFRTKIFRIIDFKFNFFLNPKSCEFQFAIMENGYNFWRNQAENDFSMAKSTKTCIWLILVIGPKMVEFHNWKVEFLEKSRKVPQKILGYKLNVVIPKI